MNYSDFNLMTNKDFKTITINNININIKKYISIDDKNDIIQIALQNGEENGIYNLLKVRMFFNLYIIYMYTDIEFTNDEKDNPVKLYDELWTNEIVTAVLNGMDRNEYQYLSEVLEETMKLKLEYRNTVASVINNFMENLPFNANAAKDIIENFNPEDFQRVLDFAIAANGNRPIN